MMLHAYDLGLINGEYLFFDMQPNQDENVENFPWKRNDDRDDDARVAYQALMTVTIKRPTSEQFVQFSEEVRLRALRDYNYNYTDETVNNFVGAFHDAVLLYAIALNETLNEGSDPKDGYNITRKMWNRTFEGITGNVSIDANGDRNAYYSILDMTDPETGKFEVIYYIFGAVGVVEKVGIIHWPGGASGPPDDVPACGFFNEYCPVADTFPVAGIVGIVIACLLILALIVVVFLYRKYKLESEIANMTWKIKYEDITFSHVNKSRFLSLNVMNKSMLLDNEDDIAEQQIFANVGHYKGSFVAVKKIHKERIDLNRDILIELKNMREVEHGHIVRFIGACVDSPCIAIVTEYCPKGSLQDILQNDSLQLDWMFRYSLINDIVKGLHFLHHSVMKRHGNLSSSNCVVDSRFVLKLADFGLEKFKANSSSSDNAFGELTKKLWVAPEVLRDPASTKTQEGDIFSLAIILHEIGSRNAPYDAETGDMSVKEIIERIKKGESPPFRPQIDRNLYPNEVRNLMESCWEENPSLRPNINAISATIKKLNRSESHSDNIMDNLLQRMEQYANNLESLVEQRTEAFLEEKKKSEQLLYSILPNSVAKQLIRGERVEPESFDCVTVYFSDIVGFTALSAGSTPLQVVDMLNDLYICFDALISNFDVYKVETIGDAYMVASGLPIRNGNRHAREVARMSLALLKAVLSFKIKHQPNHQMRLRIGIHSGPCVAGVVGLKMPRYCLFGDTVNTASRMESNGEPLKIHLSSSTHAILDTFYTFKMELRGEIEMKGKGMQTTHWLLGENLDVKDSNS
ncbi:atrial natriuretic peptide receptor 1-like [Saccoglossus kowalevskii]